MQGTGRRRLEALDGLRGVAALAVVLLHVHLYALLGMKPFSTHAYLAVDLFFMISGFILAHAYGDRLGRGAGLGNFLRARLTRLYPLYALGGVLGFVAFLFARPAEAAGIGGAGLLVLSVLASAFLPWLAPGAGDVNAFPLNPPSWSLSLEMWGNLAYGALARHLGPRALALIVTASGLVLLGMAMMGGSLNFGWRRADVLLGWPRFIFAFTAGLGLHRLWASGRLKLPRAPDWSLALVVALMLTLPCGNGLDAAVDLIAVLLVFPVLITLAADAAPSRTWRAPLALGARLSYPLYAMHAAVVAAVQVAAGHLGWSGPLVPALSLAGSIAVAWATERWFDRPVRAWIAQRGVPAGVVQPAV